MNLQVHHVISDIVGQTGLAIVDAILDGERHPLTLAKLRNERIKPGEEVIAKSLVGDYRPEHLFTLRQSLSAYRSYQNLVDECDREIRQRLHDFDPPHAPFEAPEEGKSAPKTRSSDGVLRSELKRASSPSISPEFQAFVPASHRHCSVRSVRISQNSAARPPLPPGWAYVLITISAAAKCYGPALAK
jgi:hypothetical protein